MAKQRKKTPAKGKMLRTLQPDAAGIDIGANEIFIAIPEDRSNESIRCFQTFTKDLHVAAKWLKQFKIKSIAMESTGVYWIPIFQILESYGFEVFLVNARHVKNVPGRKSDVQDCQWLQFLHSVGLLRGSYRPSQEVCAIRSLLRHRDNLVKNAGSHIQHMHKSLTQMNLQIHHVINDITGVTGLAILDSILLGERDPKKLAALKNPRIKADNHTIIKSLEGDYRSEHLFTLRQSLEVYRNYQKLIGDCDKEIEKCLISFQSRIDLKQYPMTKTKNPRGPRGNEPKFDLRTHMYRVLGVDLTQIDGIHSTTAHILFTEVGPDLSKFPTAKHFCSWLGLSPCNKISGGRILSSTTGHGSSRLSKALRMAAQSLYRSQSHLGEYFRRMRARHGSPKAITATAHKMARIIYHLLSTGKSFDGTVFSEQEILYKKKLRRRLIQQAKRLGFQLVPVLSSD